MSAALARHDALMRVAIDAHGGRVFKTVGDAFYAVFATAANALAAALAAQRALFAEDWASFGADFGALRIRCAVHSGIPEVRDGDFFGADVNRVARLMAAGHGGQILLSLATQELVRDELPEGVALRDLGERRLKDLRRPEHIYQVVAAGLPTDFPPLTTLDARPNNLPIQLTTLIGRERELGALAKLLRAALPRLVTLTGPGGTGKTHLALQAGADLIDDFPHGVYFVALASVADADLVPATIAQALGVRETGGVPMAETLATWIGEKQLLLILDNFEQLVAAAPGVADLLSGCPKLKLLVTSRATLHVGGEQEFPVEPLRLPDARRREPLESLTQYAALQLFIQRAADVKPGFTVTNENAPAVAGICHRLEGLPLAIELAAVRIKILPPEALFARLESRLPLLAGSRRDVPERQRTMRGAIAWSFDLLSPPEQRLLGRLAVFRGGWTLESAEAVCNVDGSVAIDVLDGIASLADSSLVRGNDEAGGPRFSMLETVREFAHEVLVERDEVSAIQAAHCAHLTALARDADPHLDGPDQLAWLARLLAEQDNVRAALDWALGSELRLEEAARLCAAYWRSWFLSGQHREAVAWLLRALERASADADSPVRTELVYAAGLNIRYLGDLERANAMLTEAIGQFRRHGDERRLGWALLDLAYNSLISADDLDGAQELIEESLSVRRRLGDDYEVATALGVLGDLAWMRGDERRAIALIEEAVTLYRLPHAQGIGINVARAMVNLGQMKRCAGETLQAKALLTEGLMLYDKFQNQAGIAYGLLGFASLAVREDPLRTCRLLGAASEQYRAGGVEIDATDRRDFDEAERIARAALDAEAWAAAWAEGQAMSTDEAVAYALSIAL